MHRTNRQNRCRVVSTISTVVLAAALLTTMSGCGYFISKGFEAVLPEKEKVSDEWYRGPLNLRLDNNSLRTIVDLRISPNSQRVYLHLVGDGERVLEQGQGLTVENLAADNYGVRMVDSEGWTNSYELRLLDGGDQSHVIDRTGWEYPVNLR